RKPRHNLTNYVIITNEYVNPEKPSNKWYLCRCCNNVGEDFGLVEAEKKLQEAKQEYNTKKVTRKIIKKRKSSELQLYKKSCTDFDNEQTNRSTGSIASQNTNTLECKSVIAHYHWLNPNLILPNCKQLAGRILKEAADGMQNIIKTKAQEDSNSIMLVFDEWKNVAKQKILGSILVTSRGELLIWKAKDISGEQKN
ncbi:22849_t:CDS:2, partial [Gigaspora margarita]